MKGFGKALLMLSLAVSPVMAQMADAPAAQVSHAQVATPAFPKVNPQNFTATSPTVDEVDSFLKALWGYDENRVWSVAAILKTAAPGVSKIVVFVADKSQAGKSTQTVFFTTPDGKHAIADNVISFGAKPFAEGRAFLQKDAVGAAKGATSNDLMLVEFADLQCPHCKDAQETMANLQQDFPQARIVFENYPIAEIHPFAMRSAEEGVCVRKAKGDAAFFTYIQSVFDHQGGLTAESVDATLSAAATAAGADPIAAATCAAGPEAKADVEASIKVGTTIGVDQTPVLVVNGHLLPMTSLPYEVLKKIVAHQARMDGMDIHVQPSLSTLK